MPRKGRQHKSAPADCKQTIGDPVTAESLQSAPKCITGRPISLCNDPSAKSTTESAWEHSNQEKIQETNDGSAALPTHQAKSATTAIRQTTRNVRSSCRSTTAVSVTSSLSPATMVTRQADQKSSIKRLPVAQKSENKNTGKRAETEVHQRGLRRPKDVTNPVKNSVINIGPSKAKPKTAIEKAKTSSRKRKQSAKLMISNGSNSKEPTFTQTFPSEKPAHVGMATSHPMKNSVKRKQPSSKARHTKCGRGQTKREKRRAKVPLPSFDDDNEFMEELPSMMTKETSMLNGLVSSITETTNISLPKPYSADSPEMDDTDMSGTRRTSHDDVDLDSNQSSDDDLPDVLSQESTKIHQDDVVWAKVRSFPYWPAVVKRLYPRKGKATIFFAGELNKSTQKGMGISIKILKPYSCTEKDRLVELAMKHPKVLKEQFQDAVDKAEDYITKRGLGKAQGVNFFTVEDYTYTQGDDASSLPTAPTPIIFTPSMRAGLRVDETSSPLTPPCDSPCKSIPDSSIWRSGRPLSENQNQSIDMEEESSEVDEELLEKRKTLSKLQDRVLNYIIKRPPAKEHLLNIFRGTVKSKRHELFFTSGAEAHNKLKHMIGFGPIMDDDKQDKLLMFLRQIYEENCLTDNNDIIITSYLTDVWFPEVIIFALHKTHRIGLKRAEQLFISQEQNAMEVTGGLGDIRMPSYLSSQEKKELLDNVVKKAARQLGFSPRDWGLS